MVQLSAGRAEAAAAIWSPQGTPVRARAQSNARVRRRGALRAALMVAIGTLLYFFWSQIMAYVVFSLAAIVLAAALLSPRGLYAGMERLTEALGRVTGRALSFVSLSIIFYAVFLPFGALTRRGRRDPMKRFYEPDASTYWVQRVRGRRSSHAKRLF